MLNMISKRIAVYAVRCGCIDKNQYDEYLYGLNCIFDIFINDITMIAIGYVLGMVWESVAFWLLYKIIRKYSGGYHFNTALKCYISSCIMCPVILICIKYIPYCPIIHNSIFIASVIALLYLSPVAAGNKPLDEKELLIFGQRAKIVIIFLTFIYILFVYVHIDVANSIISVCMLSAAIFAFIGKVMYRC